MATPIQTDLSAVLRYTQYRSAFEQLITSLSTRFINLPIESIDAGIVEALGKVGSYTEVDRCFVYQFVDDTQQTARLSHEWCAPGIPTIKHLVQDLDVTPLTWAVDQLASGNVVHVPDVEQLPPEAVALRELYESLGVRSAIYVPLRFKNTLAGMLGFSCISHNKVWSEDSINLLRVVGEIVVNAVDRKTAYVRLQVNNEQYASVVEDQTDFIVRWKPDGTHTFVNGAVCRFFGRTAEELLSENLFDFIHPNDVQAVRDKVASLTIDHPSTVDEHRVLRSDNTIAWHEWSDRALFDDAGNIIEYQSVGRDITQQKQAREELDYRQRLQNLILNLTSRFINLPPDRLEHEIVDALRQVGEFVDGDRTYIYMMDEQTGDASLEYEWLSSSALPTPDELQQLLHDDHGWAIEVLQSGKPLVLSDMKLLPPTAAELREVLRMINTESFVIVPVFLHDRFFAALGISSCQSGQTWSDDSTALLRLIGEVFVNALERRTAEQALTASEERLSMTIDAVADGFYDWNIPTGRVFVSDNWLVSRGLPVGNNEWTISQWNDSIHPDDRPEVSDRIDAHLRGKTNVFECEYRVGDGKDQWRWSLDRARVIERDAQGSPVRMVGVDRDITDEVNSRQRLQQADARLAHLARVATMGEIVAGIAHEVNQPLHAAATFATAVSTALESNESGSVQRATKMVEKISAQINRAANIIRRLREFTRPRPVHMARFDLNGLVRESTEMLAYEAKQKKIRTEFELDESLPGLVGDRVQIQQVIVNLLRNGFESIPPQPGETPTITIRTQMQKTGVLLEVADNGTGLAEGKDIEQLFDAFITTKQEGMGMGLALCRSIVASHHGKIWGECNAQGGMTFSVLLPVEAEALR